MLRHPFDESDEFLPVKAAFSAFPIYILPQDIILEKISYHGRKLLPLNSLAWGWLSARAIASSALQPGSLPTWDARPTTVVQSISSGIYTSLPFTVQASRSDWRKYALYKTQTNSRSIRRSLTAACLSILSWDPAIPCNPNIIESKR